MLAIIVKANTIKEKYSHGPNFRAILATWGAKVIKTTIPINEPRNEAEIPIINASPGFPFFIAIGYPSNVVATADGVPGIPNRIAEIKPPDKPPIYTPTMVAMPHIGVIAKVKGSVRTIAIVIVKPGIEPAIIPAITPTHILNKMLK